MLTLGEIEQGISRIRGRGDHAQADGLESWLREVEAGFGDRILPFDERAAGRYAEVVTARERTGPPIGTADAQIAAICLTVQGTLATGNTADFEKTGIELVNPWQLG